MNANLPICSVGYLMRGTIERKEVFLGKKAPTEKAIKRKIAGRLLGYGGDFEPQEDLSIEESFARELGEESEFSVDPKTLDVMAKILVRDEKGDRLILYYLLAWQWTGQAGSSREFTESGWFPADHLPENILDADKLILPLIFEGKRLEGFVEYNKDMNVVSHERKPVDFID